MSDPVNHPDHYTRHPSGVECIQITEHMGFNLGNAVKYIWRADEKGNALQDLEKAAWYVNREIKRRLSQVESRPAISIQHSEGCFLPERHAGPCWLDHATRKS